MPIAELFAAQAAICLQAVINFLEELAMSPEEGCIEGQAPLQDVAEIIVLHDVVYSGEPVVSVPLLSKLMDDHEAGLNKKMATNSEKVTILSSLGSYLSDLRLNLSTRSQYE